MKLLLNVQLVSVFQYRRRLGYVFEESLGSSVSNVAVSMVTEGFPHPFESACYCVQ